MELIIPILWASVTVSSGIFSKVPPLKQLSCLAGKLNQTHHYEGSVMNLTSLLSCSHSPLSCAPASLFAHYFPSSLLPYLCFEPSVTICCTCHAASVAIAIIFIYIHIYKKHDSSIQVKLSVTSDSFSLSLTHADVIHSATAPFSAAYFFAKKSYNGKWWKHIGLVNIDTAIFLSAS